MDILKSNGFYKFNSRHKYYIFNEHETFAYDKTLLMNDMVSLKPTKKIKVYNGLQFYKFMGKQTVSDKLLNTFYVDGEDIYLGMENYQDKIVYAQIQDVEADNTAELTPEREIIAKNYIEYINNKGLLLSSYFYYIKDKVELFSIEENEIILPAMVEELNCSCDDILSLLSYMPVPSETTLDNWFSFLQKSINFNMMTLSYAKHHRHLVFSCLGEYYTYYKDIYSYKITPILMNTGEIVIPKIPELSQDILFATKKLILTTQNKRLEQTNTIKFSLCRQFLFIEDYYSKALTDIHCTTAYEFAEQLLSICTVSEIYDDRLVLMVRPENFFQANRVLRELFFYDDNYSDFYNQLAVSAR